MVTRIFWTLLAGMAYPASEAASQLAHTLAGDSLHIAPPACVCISPDSVPWPDYEKALEHAPILWFANEEKYFPTMPFFSAFDGIDNDRDGAMDFADPDEIAPLDAIYEGGPFASWDTLCSWYDRLSPVQKKSLVSASYNIRLMPARQLEEIFFSDEQFWRRLDNLNSGLKAYINDKANWLRVYEYYFYYIRDLGLQGHPEDIEFVFVFVPEDTSQRFRITIGAGHTAFVPNNVLIYKKDENPWGSHLHILVELGGHASAPDRNGDGQFSPGVDANWHAENIWGTRDTQALSGVGSTGRYDTWMTFPRDSSNKVFPPDPSLAKPDKHFCYRLFRAEEFKKDGSPFYKNFMAKQRPKMTEIGGHLKHLQLPVKEIKQLSDSSTKMEESISLWSRDILDRRSLHPMGYMPLVLQYENYNDAPVLEYRIGGFVPGWYAYPGGRNDVLELQAGMRWQAERKPQFIAALYYQHSYTAKPLSWYLNLSWLKNRVDSLEFALGAGISLIYPGNYPPQVHLSDGSFRQIRLRLGARFEFRKDSHGKFLNHIRFPLVPEVQLAFYNLPFGRERYEKIAKEKHMIWEHSAYKSPPRLLFKRHLFRPRSFFKFGFWTQYSLEKPRYPEVRVAWILPVWDPMPVKLDGIIELHGGWKWRWDHNISEEDFRDGHFTFAVYYDRFYGKLFSWYGNVAWTRARSDVSNYSLGAGLSITFPPFFNTPIVNKPVDLFHYVKIRAGFRSLIDKEFSHISRNVLELQLGVHY